MHGHCRRGPCEWHHQGRAARPLRHHRSRLVEMPFNAIVTEKRAVMVDLSAVSFLSSYAIRVLLVGAKIITGKGGRLVIMCPANNVAKVLRTAGTDVLIPVFRMSRPRRRPWAGRDPMPGSDAEPPGAASEIAELTGWRDGSKAGRTAARSRPMRRSPLRCAWRRRSPTSSCMATAGRTGWRSRSRSSTMPGSRSSGSRITAGSSIPPRCPRRLWRPRSRRRRSAMSASI